MFKQIFFLFFTLTSFVYFYYGCASGNSCYEINDQCLYKEYKFSMLDSLDNILLDGNINIKDYTNNKISGTYKFINVYNDSFPGYSSMKGKFSGTVNGKENKVYINTNPSLSDYNILLNLSLTKDSLNGTWSLSAMTGKSNSGKFIATKIKK